MISIIALLLSVALCGEPGMGKSTLLQVRRNEELRTMNRALLKALRELEVGSREGCVDDVDLLDEMGGPKSCESLLPKANYCDGSLGDACCAWCNNDCGGAPLKTAYNALRSQYRNDQLIQSKSPSTFFMSFGNGGTLRGTYSINARSSESTFYGTIASFNEGSGIISYTRGDPCSNGAVRITEMHLSVGGSTELLDVVDDGNCKFTFKLQVAESLCPK